MTELVLEWFSSYGVVALLLALFFGQMGVPIPTSILLLTVGAMLAESGLSILAIVGASIAAASAGDQAAYWIGRVGGERLAHRAQKGRFARLWQRAERTAGRWGEWTVFLSRWLVSPPGPYINYLVGAVGMRWPRFTIMALAGETIWIVSYLSIGAAFRNSIAVVNDTLANAIWFVGAGIVTVYLGTRVLAAARASAKRRQMRKRA